MNEKYTRANEFKKTSSNPCKKFMSWSSNDKCFTYYDKEQQENIKVELPIKFIKLKELSTVKGWHNGSNSGIYSNEVVNISAEPLNVRAFKGGELTKGLYKDIKDDVIKQGGHYERSIYMIDGTGELMNIALKGSGVKTWTDFLEKNGHDRLLNEWVIVDEAIDMKKGAVSYSVPSFKFLKELNEEEMGEADTKYRTFMNYFEAYSSQNVKSTDKEEVND